MKSQAQRRRWATRFQKTALVGPTLGLLQTGLFLLAAAFSDQYGRAMLQLAVLTYAGIFVLVGYLLPSIERALIALLLAQIVGFFSFFLLRVQFAPVVLSALPFDWFLLFIAGIGFLLFLVGLIGSLFGAYLRDWFWPPKTNLVGWKFHGLGLLITGVAAMMPVYVLGNNTHPVVLLGSGLPIIASIAALVVAGIVSMILGFHRKSEFSSERVGLMVVAGVLILGLSLISIGSVYEAISHGYYDLPCDSSCRDLQIVGAILASSLLTSSGAIVACLFADQKEEVAEHLVGHKQSS